MPSNLPFQPLDKGHHSLIFMLLKVFHFFLFRSTTSHTLLANSAFTTSLFCKTQIIHQLLHGSLSPGGLFIGDEAFDNIAIRYVGEAPARRVALPETPVGQGAFPGGKGSLQCGQLGRWSGAKVSWVLTLRNLCGTPTTTVHQTTTSRCRPIRTGGFQDQAGLVSFGLVVAALRGLCHWWFLLKKGDHGRPLYLPRPLPDPGTS
jgi:hypothetical protein